jgi:hypothetical protein
MPWVSTAEKERAFARRRSVCGDEGFMNYLGNKGRGEDWSVYCKAIAVSQLV